jgi:hypothetical protein
MAEFMCYVSPYGSGIVSWDTLSNVWCWFGMILWKQVNDADGQLGTAYMWLGSGKRKVAP